MSAPLVPIDPAILALLRGAFGADGTLMPFVREILLIDCRVAGTSFRDLDGIDAALAPGALLPLEREHDNPVDPLAIRMLTEGGQLLGYVPRAKNEALAHLMDAGKLLFARLESKEWRGSWLKLEAKVFLRDL